MKKTSVVKVTEVVVAILESDKESRNDDRRLTFKVLQKLLGDKGTFIKLSLREMWRLPAFATITRVRAMLQNELGKYLPTSEKVRKQRRISEETWRTYTTGTQVFPGI